MGNSSIVSDPLPIARPAIMRTPIVYPHHPIFATLPLTGLTQLVTEGPTDVRNPADIAMCELHKLYARDRQKMLETGG